MSEQRLPFEAKRTRIRDPAVFEIGNSLREARLRQQLQFSVLEERTKVRPKYLRALEDEEFDVLPAPTYVKGFLKAYADALGLDGQLYVDEFNSRFVVGEEEAPFRAQRSPSTRAARRVETSAVLIAVVAIGLVTALCHRRVHLRRRLAEAAPLDVPQQTAVAPRTHASVHKPREAAHRRRAHGDARRQPSSRCTSSRSPGRSSSRARSCRGRASASPVGGSGSARARRANLDATRERRRDAARRAGAPATLIFGPHGQLTG